MSGTGTGLKTPSQDDIDHAFEWAKYQPPTADQLADASDHNSGYQFTDWQYYLNKWGYQYQITPAPDVTSFLSGDVGNVQGPESRGGDLGQYNAPKAPVPIGMENFQNITFMDAYSAMSGADNSVEYRPDLGANLEDKWQAIANDIRSAKDRFSDVLAQQETNGGWQGKTQDAVWANVNSYLPEPETLYSSINALAILLNVMDKTIFQTKWYLERNLPLYEQTLTQFPQYKDTIDQAYNKLAQEVMTKVYAPGIQFIAQNIPAFSGQTPKLPDVSPPPPPPPPAAPDLSKLKLPPPPDLSKLKLPPPPDLSNMGGPPPPDLSNAGGPPPPDLSNTGAPPPPDLSNTGGPPPPSLPGVGDPNLPGADGLSPPPSLPGVGDPNLPGADGLSPPPDLGQVSSNARPGGGLSPGLSGLSGLADPAKSLAGNPATSGTQGSAADALKPAMNTAAKGQGGAPEGLAGLGSKGPSAMGGPGAMPTGGTSGRAGVGPGASSLAGAPVAAANKELALSGPVPAGSNAAIGGSAGGGSGAGSPGGGSPGAGQRGSNEKEHKANKALRNKANGELVMGEVDAVVPVIGDDQADQQAAVDEVAQPSTRTPLPAERPHPLEQRGEPSVVGAIKPVRRSAGP